MDKSVAKIGENGFQAHGHGTKNRLRIHGTAILEREDHPSITATYDYNTCYPSDFFEEDVNQLKSFELNKIALGMTIYKKDALPLTSSEYSPRITSSPNGAKNGLNMNGFKNGNSHSHQMLESYDDTLTALGGQPLLTDVIWSRMDITNPSHNPNAYIIKQYYDKKNADTIPIMGPQHGDRCNNFICGFITCCLMMAVGCAVAFYYKDLYPL